MAELQDAVPQAPVRGDRSVEARRERAKREDGSSDS
jgi:hypothetical protein